MSVTHRKRDHFPKEAQILLLGMYHLDLTGLHSHIYLLRENTGVTGRQDRRTMNYVFFQQNVMFVWQQHTAQVRNYLCEYETLQHCNFPELMSFDTQKIKKVCAVFCPEL